MTAEETKQAIEAFEAAHPNHIEGRKVFPGYWRDVESLWIKAWEARGRAGAQQVADGYVKYEDARKAIAQKRGWLRILPAPEHTYDWDEHPEDYDGPCCCELCRYYTAQDA